MADNVTTYSVVVDTQVNGQEQIDELGAGAESSGEKFKSLRAQIRETTVQLQALADQGQQGSAEFQRLRTRLDELNDAQERVNFQAGQFDDQLSALPGPIGAIGNGIRSFNEGLNKFSLGFKVALGAVTLIVGAIAAFRESLSRTEEGQKKLNQISEAFTKILNGLFAIIEPIAMAFADLLAGLLSNEKVLKGLATTVGVVSAAFSGLFQVVKAIGSFIIGTLVNNFKTLIGVAANAGKVIKGVFTFDLDLIKEGLDGVKNTVVEGTKTAVSNVKELANGLTTGVKDAVVSGFDSAQKSFKEGSKRLTEEEKKAAEEAKKKREEEAKKRAEAAKKAAEEEKKRSEERKKALEEAGKLETEAYLATLDARDKEIFQRGQKLTEDLVKIEAARRARIGEELKKGGKAIVTEADIDKAIKENAPAALAAIQQFNQQRTALQEAYRIDVDNINKKYDDEETKKNEEKLAKEKELIQKQREDALLGLDNRFSQLLATSAGKYDELIAVVDEKERLLLSNTELTENERVRIQQEAAAERADIRARELDDNLLGIENELNNVATSFDRRRELIAQKEAELLQQEGLTENQRTQIRQQAADERMAIDMAELEARQQMQNAYTDLIGQFGGLLQQIAGKNKKLAIAGVIIEQAAAIAKIIQNTAIANAKSVAAFPITGGMPWVAINTATAALSIAATIAAGVKSIQQINQADSGGAAPTSSSSSLPRGSSGASAPAPMAPRVENTAIPQIVGTEGTATPGAQIAQTIGMAQNRPIRAFVVSGDVTTQQALDRRTNRAATFSGGTNG